jgi:NADPH:quinone reductase-like Zn-dependent oxidoreductase
MRAATYHRYGPPSVLSIADIPTPEPGPGEVLVRVRASTVSSADVRLRSMDLPSPIFVPMARGFFGVFRPRNPVPGAELSGVIESVGEGVSGFEPGDAVVAATGARGRANAEFVAFPADGPIVRKPAGLSFEEAAALSFGGFTALYFLRDKGGIAPGRRVLINGASGAVGTAAVQLARHYGAHVTGVCSGKNAELVRSIGAHDVIDYTATPLGQFRTEQPFDIVFDTVGTAPFATVRRLLAENGRYLAAVMRLDEIVRSVTTAFGWGPKVIGGVATEKPDDLRFLADLAEQGAFRPVIGRVFPLSEIAAAHALVDAGHKVGSVVIRMPGP